MDINLLYGSLGVMTYVLPYHVLKDERIGLVSLI